MAAEGEAILLGLTRQLVGVPWTGASEFQYCGSIGPLSIDPGVDATIRRIGNVLARRFRLKGLFGVDLIENCGQVWTIEINPRYTASVEVVERESEVHAIAAHVTACLDGRLPSVSGPRSELCHGKAIVFASKGVTISQAFAAWAVAESEREPWPCVADVPAAGTCIRAHQPIVTVFADGGDARDSEQQLRDRVADVRRRLAM